jgi:hypothetical protein
MDKQRFSTRGRIAGLLVAAGAVMKPWEALAQDATPGATPAVLGEAIKSQTREEFRAELNEAMGYTEAATPGGTFIVAATSDIQTVQPFLAEEAASLGVVGLIYEGLTGGDPRTGQPAPGVASCASASHGFITAPAATSRPARRPRVLKRYLSMRCVSSRNT